MATTAYLGHSQGTTESRALIQIEPAAIYETVLVDRPDFRESLLRVTSAQILAIKKA